MHRLQLANRQDSYLFIFHLLHLFIILLSHFLLLLGVPLNHSTITTLLLPLRKIIMQYNIIFISYSLVPMHAGNAPGKRNIHYTINTLAEPKEHVLNCSSKLALSPETSLTLLSGLNSHRMHRCGRAVRCNKSLSHKNVGGYTQQHAVLLPDPSFSATYHY